MKISLKGFPWLKWVIGSAAASFVVMILAHGEKWYDMWFVFLAGFVVTYFVWYLSGPKE